MLMVLVFPAWSRRRRRCCLGDLRRVDDCRGDDDIDSLDESGRSGERFYMLD